MSAAPAHFTYSKWRHGGWYVNEVRYPSGAVGCVSRNYADRKWRIACDPRPFDEQPTFKTRDDAARAEYALANAGRTAETRETTMHTAPIPEDNRMSFLPSLAGNRYMMTFEAAAYSQAAELSGGQYRGGYWDFYETDTGARYMAPRMDGPVSARSPNGSAAELTPEAFGIVVTLFALSHTSFAAAARGHADDADTLTEAFHNLRDVAGEHPEAGAIFDLID